MEVKSKNWILFALFFIIIGIPIGIILLYILPYVSITFRNEEVLVSFLTSYIGGVVSAVGVIGTTYFLIEANKQETSRAADLQDKKELERYVLQLTITYSEDTLMQLRKLKDDLFQYQHFISLAKANLKAHKQILDKEKRIINDDNFYELQGKLDKRKIDNLDWFEKRFNNTFDKKNEINEMLIKIKSRGIFYKETSLNELGCLFEKYSNEVNNLFWDFLSDNSKCDEVHQQIENKDEEFNKIVSEVEQTIKSIFLQIEQEIKSIKLRTEKN